MGIYSRWRLQIKIDAFCKSGLVLLFLVAIFCFIGYLWFTDLDICAEESHIFKEQWPSV